MAQMARPIAIAQSFRQLLASRFKNTVYGDFRTISDTIVPVQIVGSDFSDVERPAWGITGSTGPFVGEYPSASLTSAQDVAVEAITWQILDVFGYWAGPILVLTPPSSYVPFLNNGQEWSAGLRMRLAFDAGRSRLFTGSNPNLPPFWGLRLFGHSTWNVPAATVQPEMSWHRFNPPMILPATMFLTVFCSVKASHLTVSLLYREIG